MSARGTTIGKGSAATKGRTRPRSPAGDAGPFAGAARKRLEQELIGDGALTRADVERVLDVVGDELSRLEAELETRAREIVEQRQFIEKVIDALPVGLYVVDREYRVQLWNHTREIGLQGISRGEAIGRTIFDVLHRQPAELLRTEFDRVFTTGELEQFESESRASSAGGRPPRTYRISKIPLRLWGDAVSHVISVGEDVTSWKEAETRVAQAEKLAAIGQLAAGVMHEINNPLATIAACAESLSLQTDSAPNTSSDDAGRAPPVVPRAEYLRVIDAEVGRCKGIIEALLNFSRARPVVRAMVDLNDVVEQTLFLLKHHHRFKQRAIDLDLERSAPLVTHGNAEQLVQVFMALLHNAANAVEDRRAIQGPGRGPRVHGGHRSRGEAAAQSPVREGAASAIRIRTRRGDGTVVAEVTDQGAGIPRTTRSKIFEPFYTTKPIGRGTGLGLSVCYGIVADHGGRMDVESEEGVGSTFRVVLPDGAASGPSGASGHGEGDAA